MSKLLKYKGFVGSIDICLETRSIDGKVLFIEDLVTYSTDCISELESEFRSAVDDYLVLCEEIGKEPNKPFKGSFNVRVGEELHKRAVYAAKEAGLNLNEWLKQACIDKLDGKKELHNHYNVQLFSSGEVKPKEKVNHVTFGTPHNRFATQQSSVGDH